MSADAGVRLDHDADVVIIGAGAAGLACARQLVEAGLRVRVLEARTRPFGRIHTLRPSGWVARLDAGAEFVHGRPRELVALADEGRVQLARVDDVHLLADGGRLVNASDRFAAAIALIERAPDGADRPVSVALATAEREGDPRARLARAYVEGFHAADPRRASCASLAIQARRADEDGGDETLRVPDGYDRLLGALVGALVPAGALSLGVIVEELRWQSGRVEVRARSLLGTRLPPLVARAAVLTVPASLVAAARPRLSPSVARWREAARALPLGRVVKIVLRLRHAIWPREASFLHDTGAPVPTWWTLPGAEPLIVGWAGGPIADALTRSARGGAAALARRAASSLARTLGVAPTAVQALVDGALIVDWGRDPFARGAYSWIPLGGLEAQRALAAPVEDTLFYAGEADDFEGANGTVHGALRSGSRAAALVLTCARIRVKHEPPRAEPPHLGH